MKHYFTILQQWATAHTKQYRHWYECGHLGYFALVATHGPYHIAAMGLLVIGALGLLLIREEW